MAPFFPLYVRRSDGKLSVQKSASLKAAKEANEPLPEQLVSKPNAQGISDYYRICQPGHAKETDWRRKLGGMLIREIGEPDMQDKNYILSALPENYSLYEHLRVKVSDGDAQETKSKGHAGGGNERQDAYLYGYPQGRKKRFRSPAEFFPHLLWLATDETGDPNNCCCRFCSPEELELEGEASSKASRQAIKAEAQSKNSTGAIVQAAPVRKTSQSLPNTQQTPGLPRIRSYEQTLDLSYNKFLFRPGELVWFRRGAAWGLGVIMQRSMISLSPPKRQYRVQPLSHPLHHPQVCLCTQDQVRNWLAWSPPPFISQDLHPTPANRMRNWTFDTVNWREYLANPKLTSQDAEVDGSILAAKAVECTYMLFELINASSSTSASAQVSEKFYNGIFLGAEKVWLGDALRLRGPNNAIISGFLILHQILERLHPNDPSRSAVLFIGDVYTPASLPSNSPALPKSNDHLPARMRSDLMVKNQFASTSPDEVKRGQTHFFRLIKTNATLNVSDVKGRWYEASLLMPILRPEDYEKEKQNGELGDAGMAMNGHGDCNNPVDQGPDAPTFKSAWIKEKKREDAFGRSVPATFKILTQEKEPKASGSVPGAVLASAGGPGVASPVRTAAQSQLGSTQSVASQAQANISRQREAGSAPIQQQRTTSQPQGQGQIYTSAQQHQQRPYQPAQGQSQVQAQAQARTQVQAQAQAQAQAATQAQAQAQTQAQAQVQAQTQRDYSTQQPQAYQAMQAYQQQLPQQSHPQSQVQPQPQPQPQQSQWTQQDHPSPQMGPENGVRSGEQHGPAGAGGGPGAGDFEEFIYFGDGATGEGDNEMWGL